jgi:twitching motility protein PilJ
VASDALVHSQRRQGGIECRARQRGRLPPARTEPQGAQWCFPADAARRQYQGRRWANLSKRWPCGSGARKQWQATDLAAGTILLLKKDLSGVEKTLKELNAMSPDLLQRTEEVLALKVQQGGTRARLPWAS